MSKVVIIGGGVSGLSAGIYARLNGLDATIYERGDTVGGNLTGWQRDGIYIDNCIHWLTGTNPKTETYNRWVEVGMLGDEVEVLQPEVLFSYSYGNKTISLTRDLEDFKEQLLSLSPIDEKEINSLYQAVKNLCGLTGTGGKDHDEKFGIIKSMKVLPSLYKYHRLSTEELSARFVHPVIKRFIVSVLGTEFSSLALLYVFATFVSGNGGVPKGGSLDAARRMENRFLSLGGEIVLRKEAVKVNGGKTPTVEFSDGENVGADYVVLTGDPKMTFGSILDKKLPDKFKNMYDNPKMKRFSSIHAAFYSEEALNFKGDFIIDVPYKYRDIIKNPYMVLREFSHDETINPHKYMFEVMIFTDEEESIRFIELYKDKPRYKSIKAKIAETVHSIVTTKFPELFGRIRLLDVWTPATYRRYVNSEIGSYMSFTIPPKYIPKRISNRVEGEDRIILASQWLIPPSGLPTALAVGRNAVKTIIDMEKKSEKFSKAKGGNLTIYNKTKYDKAK